MFNINDLLKAMENAYKKEEETFEWTKILYALQETCSIHKVGAKNLKLLSYVCPVCDKILDKTPKFYSTLV